MRENFNSPQYKKYRRAYVTQCTVEHLVGLLVLDAFLATLLNYLDLSDAMVGIITSFATVAFVFQLFSVALVKSRFSTKKTVIFFDVISQSLFAFIYFLPFFPIAHDAKKGIVVVAVMVAQASKAVTLNLYFKWANRYVEDSERAEFSAKKECVSLICGIVFTAVMGYITDRFKDIGEIEGGLLFIALTMTVLNIINFISLIRIKDEPNRERESMRVSAREVMGHIISNKLFFYYLLIGMLGSVGSGLIGGFIGIYKIRELGLSLFVVQVINITADFVRMGVSMPFARYSKKYGFARGLFLSSIILYIGYFSVIFTAPGTKWLIIIYSVCLSVSSAGSYQNSFNIAYTLLPQKYMVQAMAILRTLTGVVSFLAALVGGKFLSIIQLNGNTVFGFNLYGQQFLAILGLSILIPALALKYKYVIKPLDRLIK